MAKMTRHRSLMTSGDDDETDISINDAMQCSGTSQMKGKSCARIAERPTMREDQATHGTEWPGFGRMNRNYSGR